MCGRYTLTPAIDALLEQLGLLGVLQDLGPRYNVSPTQMVPALLRSDDGEMTLELFRWGLVPSWAKDPSIGNRMINARSETVAEKPSFRNAFRSRRCLVLTDGWYEWQKTPRGKQPMRIQLSSGEAFAFAGIWEHWQPKGRQGLRKPDRERAEPEGVAPHESIGSGQATSIRSCAIITADASPSIAHIHQRMPVVLKRDLWDPWLDPDAPSDYLLNLLGSYRGDDLVAYPVSTVVNSPANDRPECIEPLEP